jgi:hypothetical protein
MLAYAKERFFHAPPIYNTEEAEATLSSDSAGRAIADVEVCVDIEYLNQQYGWLVELAQGYRNAEELYPDQLEGLLGLLEEIREKIGEELCPRLDT